MLAPKCATYNGRSTFANPKYLKKAQSDKPRLYEIPYDTSDPANRFCPDGEDTVTLEKESRSKLDKDKVKPYNYTYQNSLYETFKPPSKAYLDQLERAKEIRKTMWRKTFVRTKPNIAKNILERRGMLETKKPKIVQLILFIVDSGCTKHMTENLKLLCNFVEKFLGTQCVLEIYMFCERSSGKRFTNLDETPEVLKDFLTMIQRNLQAQVITVRTDRGTEFLNKTLHAYFKEEGIEHQTSTPRTPEQNGVVERRNRTLVEAARTMLSASKLPLSFWAEAVATACYTQNRSIIISTHGKTA
ncbi:retrovirus-related pol polyprotein from transposon TNT 1-94 [Tanacetum coccineum]|uniref:Retrovirus-related pol polyprotein from transposon TNT 1-94 n=1 Tax=Tanacetum coccineum TaxID=301880 RepID=A0ABQ5DYR1_9ASTR